MATERVVRRGDIAVHLTDEAVSPDEATFLDNDGNAVSLAGTRMVIEDQDDGSVNVRFDNKGTGRVCGQCQLCCKLLPVKSVEKPAGQRCRHQRTGKGCLIYSKRPWECRTFACRWLADPHAADLPRPDRAHYVIDMTPDTIMAGDQPVSVLQVWLDPAFPDAWDTPELRAFMLYMAERFRSATIIRRDDCDGFTVFPPPIADDGQWHIREGSVVKREDLVARVAAARNAAG